MIAPSNPTVSPPARQPRGRFYSMSPESANGTNSPSAQAGHRRDRLGTAFIDIDVPRSLRHRLDHLDAARMADVGEPGRQGRIGHKALDLAHMGDAHRRAAGELCGVGDED